MSNKLQLSGIRPCTWVYLLLMLFSFMTFLVGQMGFNGLEVALGVLLLALVKGQLVGAYFMGLGSIRGPWRWPVVVWLCIPGILISIAFYTSYH